jgi:hypothetical protein
LADALEHIASWATAFERIQPGLAERVLLAVCSILGWVRVDWRRLHTLLGPAAPAKLA